MFSAEANLLAPVIIVISTVAFGVIYFFSFDVWYGARTWSTSLWASKFMFVSRWNFSFPFPLLADFVSVCLIPPSSPSDWPFLLPFRREKTTKGESVRQQVGGLCERLFHLISESGFLVSICGAVKHQVLNNSSYVELYRNYLFVTRYQIAITKTYSATKWIIHCTISAKLCRGWQRIYQILFYFHG